MSESASHLFLDPHEVPVAASALRLLISDEAHEAVIRRLARDVLAALAGEPDERGTLTVSLEPGQMKITHSALAQPPMSWLRKTSMNTMISSQIQMMKRKNSNIVKKKSRIGYW